MNKKFIKFRFLVNRCISICNSKINNVHKNDECTIDEIKNVILPEMTELNNIDEMTVLPPAKDRFIKSYAHAFKQWGWDMKKPSKLFRTLAKINSEYKRL